MRDLMLDGEIFTATLVTTGFVTGDIFTLVPSSDSRVDVLAVEIQQISTLSSAPVSAGVELWRGTTTTGSSSGAAMAAVNAMPWGRAAVSAAYGPPSAGNSTASASRVFAGGFGVADGDFCYAPLVPTSLNISQRLFARTVGIATASTVPLAVTVTFRETGKVPGQ